MIQEINLSDKEISLLIEAINERGICSECTIRCWENTVNIKRRIEYVSNNMHEYREGNTLENTLNKKINK